MKLGHSQNQIRTKASELGHHPSPAVLVTHLGPSHPPAGRGAYVIALRDWRLRIIVSGHLGRLRFL
jgi:hypothetical protein